MHIAVLKRFFVHGVFWRQLLRWGVVRIPYFLQPIVMAGWSGIFLMMGKRERSALRENLTLILGKSWLTLSRAYLVFWNFGWSITEQARFKELRGLVDWEFDGVEHLDRLVRSEEGAIVLTAHMGNYDLGAYLFAEKLKRQLTMVRAPEIDPETDRFESKELKKIESANFVVGYSATSDSLAFELLDAIRARHIVAIQGDRVTQGISTFPTTLFGRETDLPSGPFALAMATHAWIYPLFVIRVGRRRYRVLTEEPFQCLRTGPDRDGDFAAAMERWRIILERVITAHWMQWYMLEPIRERQHVD